VLLVLESLALAVATTVKAEQIAEPVGRTEFVEPVELPGPLVSVRQVALPFEQLAFGLRQVVLLVDARLDVAQAVPTSV
jgi:hypothetical protein